MNKKRLHEFVRLSRRKRLIEQILKRLVKKIDEVSVKLLDDFSDAGVNSVAVETTWRGEKKKNTIYLKRDIRASVVGASEDDNGEAKDRAVAVLESIGLDKEIKIVRGFNLNSLSALIRRMIIDEERPIPEEFKGVIDVHDMFKPQLREGGSAK